MKTIQFRVSEKDYAKYKFILRVMKMSKSYFFYEALDMFLTELKEGELSEEDWEIIKNFNHEEYNI